jgi:hypothetical protein
MASANEVNPDSSSAPAKICFSAALTAKIGWYAPGGA